MGSGGVRGQKRPLAAQASAEPRQRRRHSRATAADPVGCVEAVRTELALQWQQGVQVHIARGGSGRLVEILPIGVDGIERCWVKHDGVSYSGPPGAKSAATKEKLTDLRLLL